MAALPAVDFCAPAADPEVESDRPPTPTAKNDPATFGYSLKRQKSKVLTLGVALLNQGQEGEDDHRDDDVIEELVRLQTRIGRRSNSSCSEPGTSATCRR